MLWNHCAREPPCSESQIQTLQEQGALFAWLAMAEQRGARGTQVVQPSSPDWLASNIPGSGPSPTWADLKCCSRIQEQRSLPFEIVLS